MSTITNNTLFYKAVTVLEELNSLPGTEFTKKAFEQLATPSLKGYTSPSSVFETLREMGLVTLVRKEDFSIVKNEYGYEQDITKAEYEALPMCVKSALNWEFSPRVRNWYKVNILAIGKEVATRKEQLSKDFRMLDLL